MTSQDEIELTAGELAAAFQHAREPEARMPATLAARLAAQGRAQVAAQRMLREDAEAAVIPITQARRWLARTGWLVAAAAAAAWLFVPNPMTRRAAVPSLAALHDSVAASGLLVEWAPSKDPAAEAAEGDVAWDPRTQRGVMRFRGLAPNDPRVAQYQLWIVDAERDARYPVDGGVFDVTSEGEVLVPVTARLPVGRPTLFAVTLEKPGGVVVSSRERLVLAAPVEG